ncbi:MAG: alpha/beta fold hydrolase [Elusimicrobiota bacterium]
MPEPLNGASLETPLPYLVRWRSPGKTPLLLVHGMAGNSHWWDKAAPFLKDCFDAAALDLRGHGDSAWLPDGEYTARTFVGDIESARRTLGWERMVLCGHSFGARMAIDYAASHPDRVSALVCADFMAEFRATKKRTFLARFKPRQPIYKDKTPVIERFHFQPPETLLKPEEIKAFAELCLRRVDGGYTWKTDWRVFTFQYEPAWPVFSKITMPCLILRGEFSGIMDRPQFDAVVGAVAGARGVELPGAFHHVPLDKPGEFSGALRDFNLALGAAKNNS